MKATREVSLYQQARGDGAGPSGSGCLWRTPWVPLLAPVVVFWEALVGRKLLAPNDGFQGYLPLYRLAGTLWRSGHLPAWDQFLFSGYPLLANAQAAVFYPPILLFIVLPVTTAMNLFVVLHFVIAGTGAYLLARKLCGDPVGASVAGVAFGLSGFMFGHLGHTGLIASTSWLPWSLYAFECLRERFSATRLLFASGSITLAVFAGHLQAVFVTVMVLALYSVGLGLVGPGNRRWKAPTLCLLMVTVGFGFAAVQLLPTARFVALTDRSAFSYGDAMSFSMPPTHLPLLLFPYLFGTSLPSGPFQAGYAGQWNPYEMAVYPGAAALVLAAAGLGAIRHDRRMRVFAVVAAVTSVLALGSATPLSRLVYRLPVYGHFRSWARYLVVADLLVALLAAYGVRALRRGISSERRAACRRAAGMAGVVAIAGLVLPRLPAVHQFLPRGELQVAAVAFPTLAAIVGAAVAYAVAIRGRAEAFTVVVVALDLILSFGAFSEWRTGSPTPAAVLEASGSESTVWGGVADEPGGIDRYLFVGSDIAPLKVGSTYFDYVYATDYKGLWSANGQNPLGPAAYLEAWSMSPFGLITAPERIWRQDSRLLDLFRVTTVIVDERSVPSIPKPGGPLGTGSPVIGRSIVRYEYAPRLPAAFVVGASERRSRSQVMANLDGTEPFDPSGLALIEGPCPRCPGGPPGSAGHAEIIRWEAASLTVDVTAGRPAMLVISQAWLPGWSAAIDGRRERVIRVDGVIQGIPISPGRHRVVVRYQPPGFRLGLTLSCSTLLIVGGAAAAGKLSRSTPGWRRAGASSRPRRRS